jgi:hypothetical protein
MRTQTSTTHLSTRCGTLCKMKGRREKGLVRAIDGFFQGETRISCEVRMSRELSVLLRG